MVIRRVRLNEWRSLYRQAILERTRNWNIDNGAIPDLIITPTSSVLDNQNETINYLYDLITLDESANLDLDDVEQFVSVNDIFSNDGTRSTVNLTVIRFSPPTRDLTIPRGTPFAALNSGVSAVFFVSTREVTLPFETAENFFNADNNRYEINVPVISVDRGPDTQVGPNSITSFVRDLNGFDSVTNLQPSSATAGADTTSSLIRRYRLSVIGQDRSTPNGISKYIRNNFQNVTQTLSVFGQDNERAAAEPGAVDQYIIGKIEQRQQDIITYPGETAIVLSAQPVLSISSVRSDTNTYTEGVDYQIVSDQSLNKGSIRASTAIQFTGRGLSPGVGDTLFISYTYDTLVRNIQREFENNETLSYPGRDLLVKQSDEVSVVIISELFTLGGVSFDAVRVAVETALIDYFNGLGLGEPVEISDIQKVVRGVPGVDNFVPSRVSRETDASGLSDIELEFFEYARLSSSNLIIDQG